MSGDKSCTEVGVSEVKFRRLFEAAQDGILLLNAKTGKIEDVNPYLLKLLGYSKKDLIGEQLWEIGTFKDRYLARQYFRELQEKKYVRYENLPLVTKSGKEISVEFVSNSYLADHIQIIQCNIRDITEIKKTEEELKKSEKNFNDMVTNVPGVVYQFYARKDGTTGFYYISPKAKEIFDLSIDPKSKDWNLGERIHPDEKKAFISEVGKSIVGFKDFHFEGRLLIKDKIKWFECIAVPQKINDEIVFNGIMLDITDRKKAEEKLIEGEEKYRLLSEKSKATMMLTSPDKMVSYLSPSSLEVFGWPAEDLIGKNKDIFYPEDKKKIFDTMNRVMSGDSLKNFRYRVIGKDKKIYWVSHSANPIFENGKLAKVVSVIVNIDEIKKAEEELKKEKEMAEKYLDTAGTILVAMDSNAKITLINRKGCELLGYNRAELLGKDWFKVCLPKKAYASTYSSYKKIISGEIKPFEHYENPILTKSGEEKEISWYNVLLRDYDGKIIGTLSSGEDVTEKKKIEKELKESEAKFKAIYNYTPNGIAVADLKGDLLYVNNAFHKILAYKENELVGRNFREFSFDEDLARENEYIKDLFLKKRNSYSMEKRYIRKDGKIIWVLLSGTLLFDSVGKPEFGLAMVQDITNRKRTEEELKRAKENVDKLVIDRTADLQKQTSFLSSVLENVPDMIFVKDAKDLRFELFNKAGEELLGQKRENLIGKNDYDFFPKKQANFFTQKDRQVIKNKTLLDIPEEPINTPRGERFLHTKKIPILGEKGNPEYLLGISEDITEFKKAEQKRQESEKKFKILYESSPDAIMTFDIDSFKFNSGNASAIKMFNCKDEKEFVSLGPIDISPKYQPDGQLSSVKAKKMVDLVLKKGSNYFEWVHMRKGDGEFPATILLNMVEIGGKKYIQATVRDNTFEVESKKKIEEAYAKLKELDEMKNQFLAFTSHELKTPLTPILIQSQMLEEGYMGEMTEAQKESIRLITRNMRSLNQLIGDVLDVATIQNSSLKIVPENFELDAVAKDAITTVSAFAEQNSIKIHLNSEKLPLLFMDPFRIKQVFTNLLNNAVKFSPPNTEIQVDISKKDDLVVVSVKDQGVGIKKSDQDKIFLPFFQSSPSYKLKHKGTGLGLTICKGIVEAHGGKIWVESQEGKGANFIFTLPLKSPLTKHTESLNS